MSIDSLVALFNKKIASELQFKILKNNVLLSGNNSEISQFIYGSNHNRQGKKINYIIESLVNGTVCFKYDSVRSQMMLKL